MFRYCRRQPQRGGTACRAASAINRGLLGPAGRRSVKSLLLTLTAKLAKDASGKEFIDLRMPGNRLTDPCCRIVIPVVLTPMPNEDGTS